MFAEVALGPIQVQPLSSSLSFLFIDGLHHILNPPKFFLDADVLLAGRLRLCVQSGKTHTHKSPNITCRLTFSGHGEGKAEEQEKQMCNYVSCLETDVSESEGHLRRGSPGSLLALGPLYSELASALTPAQPGITVRAVSLRLYTPPMMKDKIKDRLN